MGRRGTTRAAVALLAAAGPLSCGGGSPSLPSQPPAPIFESTGGQTTVTPDVQTEVKEQESRLVVIDETVTLGDVVQALNAVGVTPRDLVAILSALKSAGALQANFEII